MSDFAAYALFIRAENPCLPAPKQTLLFLSTAQIIGGEMRAIDSGGKDNEGVLSRVWIATGMTVRGECEAPPGMKGS